MLYLYRLRIVGLIVSLLILTLLMRLWWIQLTHWADYAAQATGNRTDIVSRSAPRGLLRDRHGRVMAENREVWNLQITPGKLPEEEDEREKLVAFLAGTLTSETDPVSTADVRTALNALGRSGAAEAVPLGTLGRDLPFDQVATIEEHQVELPAVSVATATQRHYPLGSIAADVIGYARAISKEQLEQVKPLTYPADPDDHVTASAAVTRPDLMYGPDSIIGVSGAERLLEMTKNEKPQVPILAGRRGRTVYEVDSTNTPQRLIGERPSVPGADVFLTLDAHVQSVAEKALRTALHGQDNGMGAAVVLDVTNGDVVCLASVPCMDPNDWVSGITPAQWKLANASKGLPLLDKAFAGTYPPGSIFKVISSCAAIETTKVKAGSTAYCTGRIYVGRRHEPFKCWYADQGGHKTVNFLSAIAYSCNIFFYDCVLRFGLQPDAIADYSRRFGLGKITGLGLVGEVAGEVPSPKFSINETGQPWRTGNTLNFVIGQDRLTVTPLQMASVCASVANGGKLLKPNLVNRIRWPEWMHRKDTIYEPEAATQIKVKPETLDLVRRGMRLAVTDEHGTAKLLRTLSVACAGKTGSAQHRPGKPTHAWFIAFAPYDKPRYAVCVFVAKSGTGGEVAAPVAAKILRTLFEEYDANDPAFVMPKYMDPQTIAAQRRARIIAARTTMGN